MLDFEFQRFTRHCAQSGREILPGERYYSALVQNGATIARVDFATESWHGAPEGAIGWWHSRVPDPSNRRVHWAPNEVMVEYFERLADDPHRQDVRYLLALLMIRRRVLRQEDIETDAASVEWMCTYCARNETHYRVRVAIPDESRGEAIRADLAQILFGCAADPRPVETATDPGDRQLESEQSSDGN